MIYRCCNDQRREAVLGHNTFNGIDFLEVVDSGLTGDPTRQRFLLLHFIKALASGALNAANFRIEGGERIRNVAVLKADPDPDPTISSKVWKIKVSTPGDFSTYTLRIVSGSGQIAPPPGIDPQLSSVDFSFKVECPADFDCRETVVCPPAPRSEPEIDYLAKDYASFRQLMLDRLAVLTPEWRERHPADMGVALVELLAYVGDYLSYQQDAVATEAYLGTARKRISIRRHARLVDYKMHDGSNARVWVQVRVSGSLTMAAGTQLLTGLGGFGTRIEPDSAGRESREHAEALAQGPAVFETMHQADLFADNNTFQFYTWGATECCLPKGATRATLSGGHPDLKPGMVLIFEEKAGPLTSQPEDADASHRHAVRLTDVKPTSDPLGGRFESPAHNGPVQLTEIEWGAGDALPFQLCISSTTDLKHGSREISGVSIALGNIVLADHGRTFRDEALGSVPAASLLRVPAQRKGHCEPAEASPVQPRFRPTLQNGPLTQIGMMPVTDPATGRSEQKPFDASGSAASAFRWDPGQTRPAVTLNDEAWQPRADLLLSGRFTNEFVAETDDEGRAVIRFGDGIHGFRPSEGTEFKATYRVGNGAQGNIGADSIAHIVFVDPAIENVRNPLPASGGVDPETSEHVRQSAPSAFRTQERAVTADDYSEVSQRRPDIQRAAATFRWTGSWRTAFVTVDRAGGLEVDDAFERETRGYLERFRMAGQDLEIDGPLLVSLEIEMAVCVKPDYFRGEVKRALLEVFSNRVLPDGRRGVFHPDNFTFGQTVFLSPLYAAAQSVAGVESVKITTFQRQRAADPAARDAGKLELGRLEIARLDNDPSLPEHGVLRLAMKGGK